MKSIPKAPTDPNSHNFVLLTHSINTRSQPKVPMTPVYIANQKKLTNSVAPPGRSSLPPGGSC